MSNFNKVCPSGNHMLENAPRTAPCWKCHDQKRVKATEEELKEKLHVWIDRFGVRWGLELIKGWQADGCLPCGECQ